MTDTGRVAVGWDETGRIVERPAPAEPVTVDIQRHVEILAKERALVRARVAEEIAQAINTRGAYWRGVRGISGVAVASLLGDAARIARAHANPDA